MDNIKKLERELYLVKDIALTAKAEALQAKSEVSAHERECVVRYAAINEKLLDLPDIKKSLSAVQRQLWIMTGSASTLVGLIEFLAHIGAHS